MEERIGATLKKIRKDKNIPIQSICEGIMDPANYWRLENGKIDSSFSTILRILERMNISMEEFIEAFFAAEESLYESYERELVTYFKKQEVQKLKELKQKLAQYFDDPATGKLTHVYYLADVYLAKMDPKHDATASQNAIKQYLAQCDNWNAYELNLLSNVLFIYDLDISYHFYQTARNNYSKSNTKHILSLTLNILMLAIEKKDQQKVDALLTTLKEIQLEETETYEIITRKWGLAIAHYYLMNDPVYLTNAENMLNILFELGMKDTYNHYLSQTKAVQKM